MSKETIKPEDVGSASILGLGKERPKVKTKGPRTCWICGTKMVPDTKKAFLICPSQDEHPKDRPQGIVKVKLPDSEYP